MNTITTQWPNAMSNEKRNFILQLIFTKTQSSHAREKWLDFLESASDEQEADEIIENLSNDSDD